MKLQDMIQRLQTESDIKGKYVIEYKNDYTDGKVKRHLSIQANSRSIWIGINGMKPPYNYALEWSRVIGIYTREQLPEYWL
jgi:hypothetical protein